MKHIKWVKKYRFSYDGETKETANINVTITDSTQPPTNNNEDQEIIN